MEEKPEQCTSPDDKNLPIICQECKINPSKYKCPGCTLRSCSLSCVNSHKKRTACTGKRPLTTSVPVSKSEKSSPPDEKIQPIQCHCKINSPTYKCPGCSLGSCSLPRVNSHKKRTGKRPLTSFVPVSKPEKSSPPDDETQPILCHCKINPSKYKCPGCSLRSCSLPCVNSHKERTGCTGKRPLTSFVPISQFDDNLLISDYNMLEDVKRIAESARRMRVKLCGYSHAKVPSHLKSLRSEARSRRTTLLFHSSGMSKRQKNRTYYNKKTKFIAWTIEWRFHSTDVVLVDHGVNENSTLSSVIENHLKPSPWNHSLRQFCDQNLDSLMFFTRKYPKGTKSPFRQLNIREPIREQLANMVILEYPIIHVYLPSHTYDFHVINDVPPRKPETNEPAVHETQITKGVMNMGTELAPPVAKLSTFEEDISLETKSCIEQLFGDFDFNLDFDLYDVNPEQIDISSDGLFDFDAEHLNEIGDFDFEPDLNDVYPEQIDISLDGLCDFDEELFEERDVEVGECYGEEELEEGEIA